MKDVLWSVIGSGFPRAFGNAIQSVLRETSDDVFAVYNRVGKRDVPPSPSIFEGNDGRLLDLMVQPNRGHPKVGALYAAHNAGLAVAHGRYRYVSFLQSDMQVMRWPKSMPETIDALFSLTSEQVFCVTTSFGSRGALDSFKRSRKSPHEKKSKVAKNT